MSHHLAAVLLVLVGLVAVPAAAADGPMPFAMQGGSGVLSADGKTRWITVGASMQESTVLEAVDAHSGVVQSFVDLPGPWGVPMVTMSSPEGTGLSRDGKTLILADATQAYPKTTSEFLVIDARTLRTRRTIQLQGDFGFDALSPDMKTMYLIQHVDSNDSSRYVVRAFRLQLGGTLLPGRVADRTQKSWVMQGYPMARATSADGRMVYTLYTNPGGFPFVHALDTVRGVAHCIGLPWRGSQNGFYNMRLSLQNGARTLAVHWLSGRRWLAVDTRTWRISQDRAPFPWRWAAAGALVGTAALAAAALLLLRRRHRKQEFAQQLGDLLGLAEREVVV